MFGFGKKEKKKAREIFEKDRNEVTEAQLAEVIEKEDELHERFSKNKSLWSYIGDLKWFILLLKDYFSGSYREIPWKSVAAIIATLIYVLSPIDAVLDVIPLIGYVDDAAVFGFCLKLISEDLQDYKVWKELQKF